MPKFDETQERYYTYVAVNSDLMVVSKTADPSRTGEILEVMAAKGREIILPKYYDVALKGKSARDEESTISLDIIFENRMYDLGVVFSWGGIPAQLKSPTANLASVYARNHKMMNKQMKRTMDNMIEATGN